eukprot:164782-Chlamydomonas_euryale.AAC.2
MPGRALHSGRHARSLTRPSRCSKPNHRTLIPAPPPGNPCGRSSHPIPHLLTRSPQPHPTTPTTLTPAPWAPPMDTPYEATATPMVTTTMFSA